MSAELIDLALCRRNRATPTHIKQRVAAEIIAFNGPTAHADDLADEAEFLFWTGASGSRYVHSIYHLFECPPVEAANFILAKRHIDGRRTVLSIGRAVHGTGTLNLAEIRLRGAQLGANEVHVHLLADDTAASQHIEADLRRSLVMA